MWITCGHYLCHTEPNPEDPSSAKFNPIEVADDQRAFFVGVLPFSTEKTDDKRATTTIVVKTAKRAVVMKLEFDEVVPICWNLEGQ